MTCSQYFREAEEKEKDERSKIQWKSMEMSSCGIVDVEMSQSKPILSHEMGAFLMYEIQV